MFPVSLFDHLRVTFGHVVSRHKAHVRLARTRAQWSRWLRGAEALLMAGVFFTATSAAVGRSQGYAVAGAVLAGLALAVLLIRLAFDFDTSARTHASWAAQLWLVRERYQSALSDLADGAIDLDAARVRRDALMAEVSAIQQQAAAHGVAHSGSVDADDAAPSDEQIDRLLPASLRKRAEAGTSSEERVPARA